MPVTCVRPKRAIRHRRKTRKKRTGGRLDADKSTFEFSTELKLKDLKRRCDNALDAHKHTIAVKDRQLEAKNKEVEEFAKEINAFNEENKKLIDQVAGAKKDKKFLTELLDDYYEKWTQELETNRTMALVLERCQTELSQCQASTSGAKKPRTPKS